MYKRILERYSRRLRHKEAVHDKLLERQLRLRYEMLMCMSRLQTHTLREPMREHEVRLRLLRGLIQELGSLCETIEARPLQKKLEELTREFLEQQQMSTRHPAVEVEIEKVNELLRKYYEADQQLAYKVACRHSLEGQLQEAKDDLMRQTYQRTLEKYDESWLRISYHKMTVLEQMQDLRHLIMDRQVLGDLHEYQANVRKVQSDTFRALLRRCVSYHTLMQEEEDDDEEVFMHFVSALVHVESFLLMPYKVAEDFQVAMEPVKQTTLSTEVCTRLGCCETKQ